MESWNFTQFPYIKTERLILRPLTINDHKEIYKLRSNDKINKYLDREKAISVENAVDFILKICDGIHANELIYWAINLSGEQKLIGTIGLFNFSAYNNSAEIGYELLSEFQGKGIMQEALSSVIEYGFKSMKLASIEAFSHHQNYHSTRLLSQNNFKIKAIEGNYYDSQFVVFILSNPLVN